MPDNFPKCSHGGCHLPNFQSTAALSAFTASVLHLLEANLSPATSHWLALNKFSGTTDALLAFNSAAGGGDSQVNLSKFMPKPAPPKPPCHGCSCRHLPPRRPASPHPPYPPHRRQGGGVQGDQGPPKAVNWTSAFLVTDGSRVQVRLCCNK